MTLRLKTAATEEPVSVSALKDQVKIDQDDLSQDEELKRKLKSARRHVEKTVLRGRALLTSEWELRLDQWPCKDFLEVPLGNLQTVDPIRYRLSDGTEYEFTDFRTAGLYVPADDQDNDAGFGRIYVASGKSWPSSTLDVAEPIAIPFTCGWDTAAHVPADIQQAILMLAAHFYRNREAVVIGRSTAPGSGDGTPMIATEMARSVEDLCSPYVDRRLTWG